MKLRSQVTEAAAEVKSTAKQIGDSVQWNTAALIAVTIVSVAALFMATAALSRSVK